MQAAETRAVLLKKIVLLAALGMLGVFLLGGLSREKARGFVRFMLFFFVLGSAWRIGAWWLSL